MPPFFRHPAIPPHPTRVEGGDSREHVEKLIKPDEDSVRVYVLDSGAVKRTITYGSEQPRNDDAIIV